MLYLGFSAKEINMTITLQGTDPRHDFVCEYETSIRNVRHIR